FALAVRRNVTGVGVDVSPVGPRIGRDFYSQHLPDARVTFAAARAESLPFLANSFDVINCGLALPYMDNKRALAEMSRLLTDGGVLLLKIHHASYYAKRFLRGLATGDVGTAVHGARVLVAGSIYHVIQRQPRSRVLNETFQTRWMLRRELSK